MKKLVLKDVVARPFSFKFVKKQYDGFITYYCLALGMDGPNVNESFERKLKKDLKLYHNFVTFFTYRAVARCWESGCEMHFHCTIKLKSWSRCVSRH